MSKSKTFILSDETIANTYGFRIIHKGGKLERFLKNPVMLNDHINSTRTVLGRWLNARFEGTQLKAETDFDLADETVKPIAGKVERDFIKGASIGIIFDPIHLAVDEKGELVLLEWELLEASICAVPSNGNAISLFSKEGDLLTEKEVKQLCLSASTSKIKIDNKNQNNMEKLILSATTLVALGMQNADDVAGVSAAIEKLALNYSTEKSSHDATKLALKNMTEVQAKKLVEEAVLAGKITADLKDSYIELASNNFDLASKTLGAMPGKASLSNNVNNTKLTGDDPKNIDEFAAMPLEKQLAFKNEKPEAYTALFA